MNLISAKLIEILREGLGDQRSITRFYLGNPTNLASADLPCIFVAPQSKTIEQLDNVYDLMTCEFVIGVCVDPAKYITNKLNEDMADKFLMEIEGGRDTNGDPLPYTLTYVLRNKFTLEGAVLHQEHHSIWGEREMAGGVAKELHCYITVKQKVKNT